MSEDDRQRNPARPGWYYPSTQEQLIGEAVARIDERTRNTESRVGEIARDMADIRNSFGQQYVGQQEFKNLAEKVALHQKILFGAIGVICLAVLSAIIALVVNGTNPAA